MPVSKRRLLAAALGIAIILTVSLSGLLSPRPTPSYRVTDLGVLPGYGESSAKAVNHQGNVAGFVSGQGNGHRQVCLFQGGRLIGLGSLPGTADSTAEAINSQDEMTGQAGSPSSYHAVLFRRGKTQSLGSLPGFSKSLGMDINNRGEIVGNIINNAETTSQGFLYHNGRMVNLGTLLGCSMSHAVGINAVGQIVGTCRLTIGAERPFLYDSRTGTMTILPVPAPYLRGWVNHVNDSGQVIGDVSLADGSCHAVLWRGNQMTDLGTPSGYPISIGSGLNNRGEAVGHCFMSAASVKGFLLMHTGSKNPLRRYLDRDSEHAFVYQGGRMQDLNQLIPADANWILENARSINDQGQTVGEGLHHGQRRGFLLTPIH